MSEPASVPPPAAKNAAASTPSAIPADTSGPAVRAASAPEISASGRFDLPVPHGHLEAILREPERIERAVVVCHPHPKGGGTMNNNVVYRIAKSMSEAGGAVLRFNFRGVGRSTGEYAEGTGEIDDVEAALDFMAALYPGVPLWLAGFSFGARVGLVAGIADARVAALLGVGLATRIFDLGFLQHGRGGKPLAVIQAAQDEYGGRAEIEAFVGRVPEPRRLWIIDDATHLFPGRLDPMESAVGEAIAWLKTTAPSSVVRAASEAEEGATEAEEATNGG